MSKPFIRSENWNFVREAISAWMRSVAGDEAVQSAFHTLPADPGDTSLRWLADALGTDSADDVDGLAKWLQRQFAGIRAYHGTRLPSPEELQNGLLILDAEKMRELARTRIAGLG